MSNGRSKELQERCRKFALSVILLVRKLPSGVENREIGKQLIRSAGSVGANYVEAQQARTVSEFYSGVRISLREANESTWWLELLHDANGLKLRNEIKELLGECHQLSKIFATISLRQRR